MFDLKEKVRLKLLNIYFNEIKLRCAAEYAACNRKANPINKRNLLKYFTDILFDLLLIFIRKFYENLIFRVLMTVTILYN